MEGLNPALAPNGVNDGNGVRGRILGSKDVSRESASRVGATAGLDIRKKDVARDRHLVDGRAQQVHSRGAPGSLLDTASTDAAFGNRQSQFSAILDTNRDGSLADDIINLSGRLLR